MIQRPLYSNLLVRVPNWLGDTMMATPAISAIRKAFPKTKLTILSKPAFVDFWGEFPGVDQVITLERGFFGFWGTARQIQKKNFDAALTLPGSFSSAFLLFAAGIPLRAGWGGEGRDLFLTRVVPRPEPRQKHLVWEFLELAHQGLGEPLSFKSFKLSAPVGKNARDGAAQLLKTLQIQGKKGFIALGPGATYGPAKRWPLTYWKQLIQKILKTNRESLLVLGGAEEVEYLKELFTP